MKQLKLILVGSLMLHLASCGDGGKSRADLIREKSIKDPYENWKDYQGVGPIKAFTLPDEINQELAAKGSEIYELKCTACHKPDKKFIGPAPKDILSRRNPAWVMNMILDPEKMVKEDPIAKKLLIDYNGSPMANQNLTEDEARAVLEYFRTL